MWWAEVAGEEPAGVWGEVAEWFEREAAAYAVTDHTDRFFVEHLLGATPPKEYQIGPK